MGFTKIILLSILLSSCCQAVIKRDPALRALFMRTHPCPANGNINGPCPGSVVDNIQALKHGGADHPENMQWQTIEDGKSKDSWE